MTPARNGKKAATSPLDRVRRICLALPEAHEVEAWGEPTFRVRNKLFAMYAASGNHHGGGRPTLWIKSTHVNQDLLMMADAERYFSPPYVGPSGWVGMYLDRKPDWKALADIVRDAWCLTAPKKLAVLLEER
ncbi:MAG: MmcQ/YjbR family DNA-binding protein [Gemmatimonadales bacterium]